LLLALPEQAGIKPFIFGYGAVVAAGTGGDCAVSIQMDNWGSGYVAHLNVTNNGSAWNGWTLTFTASSGVSLVGGWNGDWSQSGTTITVTNTDWNGSVGAGQSVSPGHQATHSGNATLSNFAVNGVACSVS
jgi:hypothetical protein